KYNGNWGIKDKWGDFDLLLGAYRINLKIREYPVSYEDRIEGETKMTNIFLNGLRMLYIIISGFIKIRF
ncbi:MAG: glycosyl transferase, partial [Flavobacteriaceae bacterium]|nr:glycosyl transferase [Flavobacteriaceae bacterium]